MSRRLGIGLFVGICSLSLAGCFGCGGGERQDEGEPEGEFPVEIVAAEFPAKQRLAETTELTLTVANVGDETIPNLAVTAFTVADEQAPEIDEQEAVGLDEADTSETDVTETAGETATDDEGAAISEDQLGNEVDQALEEELEQAESETTEEDSSEDSDEETTSTEQELPEAEGAFSVLSDQPDLAIPSRPVWILEQGYPRLAGTEAGRPPAGEIAGSGGAEAAQTNTFAFGPLDPNETTELVFRVTAVQDGTYTVHYRIAAGLQGKAVAVNEDGSVPQGEFVVRISDVPPQTRVDDSGNVVPIQKGDIIGQAGSDEQKQELGQ